MMLIMTKDIFSRINVMAFYKWGNLGKWLKTIGPVQWKAVKIDCCLVSIRTAIHIYYSTSNETAALLSIS